MVALLGARDDSSTPKTLLLLILLLSLLLGFDPLVVGFVPLRGPDRTTIIRVWRERSFRESPLEQKKPVCFVSPLTAGKHESSGGGGAAGALLVGWFVPS